MVKNCHRKLDWKRMPKGVAVNGRRVEDAFYVDGRRGVVRYYVRVDGHFTIDPADQTRVWSKEVRGRVRWIWS